MIVGQMSLAGFPMWEMCLYELSKHCDELYLRIDLNKCDSKITIDDYNKICNGKVKKILKIKEPFHKWHFRQQLIEMLKDIKPNIVISIDEDEKLDNTVDDEIKQFSLSDKKCMMISYNPMPTKTGKVILNGKPYPLYPHCKVLKWQKDLNYNNYHGNALPPMYHNKKYWWISKTKITHYCFYDENWYENKVKNMKIYSIKGYFKTYYGCSLNGKIDV
jgi:hypothetical protein